MGENLESLTDEQIQKLSDSELGDEIEKIQPLIQKYCAQDSDLCRYYKHEIQRYWAEEHRRHSIK